MDTRTEPQGGQDVTESHIAASIEEFIRTRFAVASDDPAFGRDVEVFDRGYVDSVGVVELLDFVQRQFGLGIPDHDVLSDEFSTINGIARIIARYKAHAA